MAPINILISQTVKSFFLQVFDLGRVLPVFFLEQVRQSY